MFGIGRTTGFRFYAQTVRVVWCISLSSGRAVPIHNMYEFKLNWIWVAVLQEDKNIATRCSVQTPNKDI
jgi:hypothetical protein